MWNITSQPKSCGHPLNEVDYTCIMCVYVELCRTRDKLHEAECLIEAIGDSQSQNKRLAMAVNGYFYDTYDGYSG